MSFLRSDESASALNRRSFLGLVAASGAMLGLSACGSSNTSSDSSSGETRVIKDIDDQEVTIPAKPQRVVVLSEPTLDGALALGFVPIASVAGRGQSGVPNYLKDKSENIKIIGTVAQVDYEEIGNLNPDLILADATGINKGSDAYSTLEKIAPVVYCGYAGGDWKLNFNIVANALNLESKGKEFIDAYYKLTEETKTQLAPQYGDKTFSIVRWTGSGPALILKELPAGQALEDLGLKRPASQDKKGKGHSMPVSRENLNTIDADYMFLGTLGGASQANPNAQGVSGVEGAQEALDRAKETSGFTNLEAYKQDHIMLVDGSMWTSTGGPLLLQGIVEDVKKHLLK